MKSLADTRPNDIVWHYHVTHQTVAVSATCRRVFVSSGTQAFAPCMNRRTFRDCGPINKRLRFLSSRVPALLADVIHKENGYCMVVTVRLISCGAGGALTTSQRWYTHVNSKMLRNNVCAGSSAHSPGLLTEKVTVRGSAFSRLG